MTLLAVAAELDNSTVVRLEAWLEQRHLESEARALASSTLATTAGAHEPPASMFGGVDTGGVVTKRIESAARGVTGYEVTEGQAAPPPVMHAHATTIQAQVRFRTRGSLCGYSLSHRVFLTSKITTTENRT